MHFKDKKIYEIENVDLNYSGLTLDKEWKEIPYTNVLWKQNL